MGSAALPNQSTYLRALINLNGLRHRIYLRQVFQIFDVVVYEIEVKFQHRIPGFKHYLTSTRTNLKYGISLL